MFLICGIGPGKHQTTKKAVILKLIYFLLFLYYVFLWVCCFNYTIRLIKVVDVMVVE